MPLYTYEDAKTGMRIEILRPVDERDEPLEFVRVPAAPGVVVAHKGPPSMREGVLRGYYEAEQRDGSRFRSGFNKSEILEAWKE